jgi:TldD protein
MLSICLTLAISAQALPPETKTDAVLAALLNEMQRSKTSLPKNKDSPLYYLSYRVADATSFQINTSLGALSDYEQLDPLGTRQRTLDVMVRVGSRTLDNTHQLRGSARWDFDRSSSSASLPTDDDARALQIGIWRATDQTYKAALKGFIKVKTDVAVKVDEQDKSNDFSNDKPSVLIAPKQEKVIDTKEWTSRLKKISALFKLHPDILGSNVSLSGTSFTSYFVDSDGAVIREPHFFMRFTVGGSVKAADGMDLDLYDSVEVLKAEALPTEEQLLDRANVLIAKLQALKVAPAVDPYSGPAIITNRAAAVFFHEILGHRLEGHRQKDADDGQTFTRKLNQSVMPSFLSVTDDPTTREFNTIPLNGFYQFDEDGQPASKATLVENGILKGFLMGRSPIKGFDKSNGHGRAMPTRPTVARQGNLLITSSKTVPFAQLKLMLIEAAKAKGKPYGLIFDEISGGFTNTRTGEAPQAFKVLPLVVKRVYVDGRPDELVRGVDMVGTPLSSIERILATGDDPAIFNGFCGAESGWVPVSAVAPSMLVSDIEIERRAKRHDKAPLLPSPLVVPTLKNGGKR